MWKPPERIKHEPNPGRWPSAEEAARSRRFIPGLKELADTVRRASGGHTRLFIQCIDFLNIRRRPEPDKYFQRFLRITDAHRKALGAESWPEEKVRAHL